MKNGPPFRGGAFLRVGAGLPGRGGDDPLSGRSAGSATSGRPALARVLRTRTRRRRDRCGRARGTGCSGSRRAFGAELLEPLEHFVTADGTGVARLELAHSPRGLLRPQALDVLLGRLLVVETGQEARGRLGPVSGR